MDNTLIILSGLIYTNKVMYNQAYKLAHYLKNNVTIKTLQVIEDKDLEILYLSENWRWCLDIVKTAVKSAEKSNIVKMYSVMTWPR